MICIMDNTVHHGMYLFYLLPLQTLIVVYSTYGTDETYRHGCTIIFVDTDKSFE